MTLLWSDNIVSALGFTTEENVRNVAQGVCGLKLFVDRYGLPEPFMASEIDDARLEGAFEAVWAEESAKISAGRTAAAPTGQPASIHYTKPEKAAIVSVAGALRNSGIDPSGENVLFILSTTKGNIFLLDEKEQEGYEPDRLYLWRSAGLIARFFGNPNPPEVLSNACVSGASAILEAQRILRSGRYESVVVTGVDVLSKFVVAGFQSFKALSPDVCRPFDAHRAGLNLGEAAATLVLTERSEEFLRSGDRILTAGVTRNDANHISGPSRTGEGAYLALRRVMEHAGVTDASEIAFVNGHGTATPYNDEMESIALTRAGLQGVPVNSLKGYFGHTLGAAGVLESILSTRALQDGVIFKTGGFETLGVTNPLDVVQEMRTTNKRHCLKMLSGFGGCNVAVLFTKYESR
jgi:3-oxoacyl-[acyl-carrier-protein] synthase-1